MPNNNEKTPCCNVPYTVSVSTRLGRRKICNNCGKESPKDKVEEKPFQNIASDTLNAFNVPTYKEPLQDMVDEKCECKPDETCKLCWEAKYPIPLQDEVEGFDEFWNELAGTTRLSLIQRTEVKSWIRSYGESVRKAEREKVFKELKEAIDLHSKPIFITKSN